MLDGLLFGGAAENVGFRQLPPQPAHSSPATRAPGGWGVVLPESAGTAIDATHRGPPCAAS
jgi:hypothetical protein